MFYLPLMLGWHAMGNEAGLAVFSSAFGGVAVAVRLVLMTFLVCTVMENRQTELEMLLEMNTLYMGIIFALITLVVHFTDYRQQCWRCRRADRGPKC